jgi:tetratricopeptide (TPR) repeat protein
LKKSPQHPQAKALLAVCPQVKPSSSKAPGESWISKPAKAASPKQRGIPPTPPTMTITEAPKAPVPEKPAAAGIPNQFVPLARSGSTQVAATSAPGSQTGIPPQDGEIWISGEKAPISRSVTIPAPDASVMGWRVSDFLQKAENSLGISIEYAKYCIEKGDLAKAQQVLTKAETMAAAPGEVKRMMEVLIQQSLVSLYQADLRTFGQLLLRIKPMLSKQTLNSFLDIYNKSQNMQSPVDVARMIGGIAMGAEHFLVAQKILTDVVKALPKDAFAWRLLAEAQLESRDFADAERSFLRLAALQPDDPETNFNLARFYLTARYHPEKTKEYAARVMQINPGDERAHVMMAIARYFLETADAVQPVLKNLLNTLKDPHLKDMIQRVSQNCSQGRGNESQLKADLANELALPGAERSSSASLSRLGEEYLKRGSFFLALKCFVESRNLAEIGRVYLALASNLAMSGDTRGASVAAGFGLNALKEDLHRNPGNPRAHLYLALYYHEQNNLAAVRSHVEAGLLLPAPADVQRNLQVLKQQAG